MGVAAPHLRLLPEDKGRLLAYSIGASWALIFAFWTPSQYAGIVSQVLVHVWSGLMGVGSVLAVLGVLTHRDTKLELSGLYLIEFGGLMYLIAQFGFAGTHLGFLERLPLSVYILWHMSLLTPRLFGLESYRRRVRASASTRESR